MRVKWETWGGDKYEGEVIEVDSNVLHVRLDNGQEKAVEMDACECVILEGDKKD
jgi:hypothetical protein